MKIGIQLLKSMQKNLKKLKTKLHSTKRELHTLAYLDND